MKKLLLICLLSFCSIAAFAQSSAAILGNNTNITRMLKKVMPSVVNIRIGGKVDLTKNPLLKKLIPNITRKQRDKLANMEFQAAGSGVIINGKKGIIVTNAHVVENAQTIIVNLNDGRRYAAKVLGIDKAADIAVLQIHAENLQSLPLADSNNLKVGDLVVAIGNPFGLQQTVTSGIVSALHRSGLHFEGYENFIQTDAPINSGNSGGALVDRKGKLVGINTAILSSRAGGSIGIGFAIPANMVKSLVAQIIKYGNVKHGSLGVGVQNLSPQLATALGSPDKKGVVVSQVMPFTPAAKAKIKVGDVITHVNGQPIVDNGQLRAFIGMLRVGTKLTIQLIRQHKQIVVHASVGNSKKTLLQQKLVNPFLHGLTLRNVTGQMPNLTYYKGVEVIDAEPNSLPWSMGISDGDVILSANGALTPDIQTLDTITSKAKKQVLLQVMQKGHLSFLLLQ